MARQKLPVHRLGGDLGPGGREAVEWVIPPYALGNWQSEPMERKELTFWRFVSIARLVWADKGSSPWERVSTFAGVLAVRWPGVFGHLRHMPSKTAIAGGLIDALAGTVEGAILLVGMTKDEGVVMPILNELASTVFTYKAVEHWTRRDDLDPQMVALDPGEYKGMVMGRLWSAIDEMPGDLRLSDMVGHLRARVRSGGETDLGGTTLDTREFRPRKDGKIIPGGEVRGIPVISAGDPKQIGARAGGLGGTHGFASRSDDLIDLEARMATVDEGRAALLRLWSQGYDLKQAADRLGLTHAAARQKKGRGLKDLGESLGDSDK